MRETRKGKIFVGWREWVVLPSLGIRSIKAKIDTGARTSALHAFDVVPFRRKGTEWVRFSIHPLQRNDVVQKICTARVVDKRGVTTSGGHREVRYVIEAELSFGDEAWPVELSLADRDQMGFRLLIGRTALHGRIVVDPGLSYLTGKPRKPNRPLMDVPFPAGPHGKRRGP